MPVKIRDRLETATSRGRLPPKKRPYWGPKLSPGWYLGYRALQNPPGPWVARTPEGESFFGYADDHEPSDGKRIFSFHEAVEEVRKLMRKGEGGEKPKIITLDQALKAYGADLEARNADPYNAKQPRRHLPPRLLSKQVALITKADLEDWCKSLAGKGMKPTTFKRLRNRLRAALELAAPHRSAVWKAGLKRLSKPDAQEKGSEPDTEERQSDNVVLTDTEVLALVRAAYHHDYGLGLLCDVLAATGARPSQAVRVQCRDLRLTNPNEPRLDMPRSGKGGEQDDRAKRKKERYTVSVSPALASKLSAAARGRPRNARLLLRSNGKPWGDKNVNALYRRDIAKVLQVVGLDPTITLYALRHSSVMRMLLKNVPIRIIAAAHDTSVKMIESNYSVDVDKYSDAWTRSALLPDLDIEDIVVPLVAAE